MDFVSEPDDESRGNILYSCPLTASSQAATGTVDFDRTSNLLIKAVIRAIF
jgi:hypothetical protein